MEGSDPGLVDLSMALLECPHATSASCPQNEISESKLGGQDALYDLLCKVTPVTSTLFCPLSQVTRSFPQSRAGERSFTP